MKDKITTAVTFAVAIYCLLLLGMITNSVYTIKEDVKEIKRTVNYFKQLVCVLNIGLSLKNVWEVMHK